MKGNLVKTELSFSVKLKLRKKDTHLNTWHKRQWGCTFPEKHNLGDQFGGHLR